MSKEDDYKSEQMETKVMKAMGVLIDCILKKAKYDLGKTEKASVKKLRKELTQAKKTVNRLNILLNKREKVLKKLLEL